MKLYTTGTSKASHRWRDYPDNLFPHLTVLLLLEESEKQLREVLQCFGNDE